MIIYIQIHMLYDLKIIKFDLIIYDIINKERHMLVIKKIILLYSFIIIIKINNSLKTILTILISSIAKFMFFIRLLIVNLNIFLLNVKSNFFI